MATWVIQIEGSVSGDTVFGDSSGIRCMTLLAAQAAFYYMAAASVVSAILAVTRKNPVHSMLWVLALFMHVAGIFLLLGAEFLAAVQVVVYAGAILVFYLFVLMLLDLPGEEAQPRFGHHWPLAAAVGLSFGALAWLAGTLHDPGGSPAGLLHDPAAVETAAVVGAGVAPATEPSPETPAAAESLSQGSISEIGMALFGPFALPFEIASLVLLAAIVGAVVLARRREAAS